MKATLNKYVRTGSEFTADQTLETVECTCGIMFAAPARLIARRQEDGKAFYCPHGHSLVYNKGKTSAQALAEELERERDRRAGTQARLDQERAHSRTMRGVATRHRNERDRLKARAAAGVCPCCNRTFKQLARHMKTKHPDFASEAVEATGRAGS